MFQKKNKAIILFFTMHNDSKLDPETNKPDIISDYDANSGGIDTVDKIFMNYSSSRNNRNFIQHSKHSECPKIQNDISKELVNIFDETLSDEERTTISKKKYKRPQKNGTLRNHLQK